MRSAKYYLQPGEDHWFYDFHLPAINTVFSNNRITAGRRAPATVRGEQATTNPTVEALKEY
jgi:hypothetical protein